MVEQDDEESRSLALTPTWSVATVLTVFVAVSLLVERSIYRLCNVSLFPHFYFSYLFRNSPEIIQELCMLYCF